jgi:hypothetical protein
MNDRSPADGICDSGRDVPCKGCHTIGDMLTEDEWKAVNAYRKTP